MAHKEGYHHKRRNRQAEHDVNLLKDMKSVKSVVYFYRNIKSKMCVDCTNAEFGFGKVTNQVEGI